MIACPVCRNKEYEGELFCSECGSRLWGPAVRNDVMPTITFDTRKLRDITDVKATKVESFATQLKSGQVAVVLTGTPLVILEGKTEYTLGRESDNEMPELSLTPYGARDKGVSRKHAKLKVDRRQLLLIDLGSANGTWLNGAQLLANEPTRLESGDEIRLGKLTFKIHFNL